MASTPAEQRGRTRSRARTRARGIARARAGTARHGAWPAALAMLAALAGPLSAPALAAPLAGTAISNTADGLAAGLAPVRSNTVVAIVQPLESLTLGAAPALTAPPGDPVTFAHRLTNAGNAGADVRLDLANLAGDGFDLATLALYEDRNRDGTLDPGDPALTPGVPLAVAAGDSVDVLVTGVIPGGAPALALARVSLIATTVLQGARAAVEDTARTPVSATPPALAFYGAPDFAQTIRVSALGQPLYLQAAAPGCDLDPSVADTISIDLASALTGDRDRFRAVETSAASGLFRITPAVATTSTAPGVASSGDGVLELYRGDEVTATLAGCGAALTTARLWIEPFGVVFDARSGVPVPGTRVALIDVTGEGNGGVAGGPARVFQNDGVTPAPSEVVTDAQGRFGFPRVAVSTYRLAVGAPAPYAFPAPVPPAALPAGFLVDAAGSYGAPFRHAEADAPVVLDVPVDAGPQVALFAEMSASRSVVEIGEALEYAVRVANRSDSLLAAVTLNDGLPPGFAYVRGSARRDGAALADPAGGAGPGLDFALGALAPRATVTLTCRVRIGAGARFGDALNQAVAGAGPWRSNVASVSVRVAEGPFTQDASVVGSVVLVGAGDPLGALGAPGIAGVRLWLDDGTFAITDGRGRYSFTGVTPRTHALKVDAATLPAGARLVSVDHRDAGQPGLRFVDLTRGELQRAEFAVAGDSTTVRETGQRMIAADSRRDDLGRELARGTAPLLDPGPGGDARALPSQAITTGENALPLAPPRGAEPALAAVATRDAPSPVLTLDQLARGLDPDLGFIGLADLDTVGAVQMVVRVKGRIGTALALRVNGERVPDTRIGLRVTVPDAGVEAWEYLGVPLQPGLNVLEVAPPQSAGRVAVRVIAPGPLARLELEAPRRVPADGRSLARVRVRARDAAGVPCATRTLVTITSSAGRLLGDDLDPAAPGLQVAVEGGEASVLLQSSGTPGDAHLVVSSGALEASADVRIAPELRPLLAVGAVEGLVGFGRAGTFRRGEDGAASSFEATIDQFSSVRRDGQAMAGAHGAVFMKGRVRDDLLLTLGYDSDRPRDFRQFRDLQPEAAYPLFGDGATRGYEAQSTGRLYARLDRGPASVLYGDFVTRGPGSAQSLAAYDRSLTGAQTHWEQGRGTVDAFTSRGRSHQRVVELRGVGLSGPYVVPGAPLVENSERVEIVVRDRNQPAVVLSADTRQRFVDYELEPLTGRLTFRAPVPSVDAALDPVFIRVTAETEAEGDAFWVSGAEGRYRLGERVEVGGTYVDDHDPLLPRELRGASLRARLGGHARLTTEVAATREPGADPGYGSRLELAEEGSGAQARLWAAATGARFDNPGAGFAPGRTEGGANLTQRLGATGRLRGEALWSADAFGRDRRGGLMLGADRPLGSALRGELGVRAAGERRRDTPSEPWSAAVRSRLSLQLPKWPAWSGYAEAEQDVRQGSRRMAAVGGEYRVASQGRIYVRHELISSLSGVYALTDAQRQLSTVAGVDADLTHDTHLFSEYRLGDALAARESQAALGLRNGWRLADGVRLGTSLERVSPLRGDGAGPATAASASVDYGRDAQWRGSSRIEVRSSRAADSYLQTMAAAVRLDSAWTALFRHHFDLTDATGGPGAARMRLQLGAAWRPGGAWDGLGRWEFHYDRDGLGPAPLGGGSGLGLGGVSLPDAAPAAGVPGTSTSRRRLTNVLALNASGRLDRHFVTSLAWAGKRVRDEGEGGVTRGAAQWARARGTLDLARGWDVGVQSSALIGARLAERRTGLGLELGRQVGPGLWLSLGWNYFGYRDDELTGTDWTRSGAYLRLRAKFDEELFGVRADAPGLHEPEAPR